ncbi:MAG: Hsp20/alpha crystallin family protein [Candidatus Hodarchaeales archaeon]
MLALRTMNPFRVINTFFGPYQGGVYCPRTDLLETADSFLLKVDLPGFDKEDLDIQATSEYIVIKAVRKEVKDSEDSNNEDSFRISRRIDFPVKVSPDKAKVSLDDGVLSIDMPKSEEAKAVKLIPK